MKNTSVKNLELINNFALLLNSLNLLDNSSVITILESCSSLFNASFSSLIIKSDKKDESEVLAIFDKKHNSIDNIKLKYTNDSPLGIVLNEFLYTNKPNYIFISELLNQKDLISALGDFNKIFDIKKGVLIPLVKIDILLGFLVLKVETLKEDFIKNFEEIGHTLSSLLSSYLMDLKLYRKNAEIQNYLSSLVQGALEPIISIDLESKIILWNKGAELLFNNKNMTGKNLYHLFSSEFRKKLTLDIIEVFMGKSIINQEAIGIKNNQELFPIQYNLSPIHNTYSYEIEGALINIKDNTHLKKIEHEISQTKNNFKIIFDNLDEILIVFDKQINVVFANKFALNYLSCSKKELNKILETDFILTLFNQSEKYLKEKVEFRTKKFNFGNNIFKIQIKPILDSLGKIENIILQAQEV